jgi:hypothetical protein
MPILNLFFYFHVVSSDGSAVDLSRYGSVVLLVEVLMLFGGLINDHGELAHVLDSHCITALHGGAFLFAERVSHHFVRVAKVVVRIKVEGERPESRHLKSKDHSIDHDEGRRQYQSFTATHFI